MKFLAAVLVTTFSISAGADLLWPDQASFDKRKLERVEAQTGYIKTDLENPLVDTSDTSDAEKRVLFNLLAKLDSYQKQDLNVETPTPKLVVTKKEKFYIEKKSAQQVARINSAKRATNNEYEKDVLREIKQLSADQINRIRAAIQTKLSQLAKDS